MQQAGTTPRNVQHNNAQNAVLFEAIGLAIHLDANSPLVGIAAQQLAVFISSKETNVRYLGLDAMAHLAARADSLDAIKRHQETIINSLRDKDISVRRRALDLLYSMCDVDNAEVIVGELLRYLQVADYGLREEMVLKIAIATERYATNYQWYVDTIFSLISAAGDHVSDEVWYRVIQIVTNTEDLQEYAAKAIFEHLRPAHCHESLVKVAGYILGEYGHVIANDPGYSPAEQFQMLHAKSPFCAAPTRALLLSTYIKWVNVFPEIKVQLIAVFERYRHVLDAELQQRACEYYALATRTSDDELLQNVCEEMPPFPARESTLLMRLNKKHGDTNDKRIWNIGGKDANLERKPTKKTTFPMRQSSLPAGAAMAAAGAGGAQTADGENNNDILNSLAGLDLSSPAAAEPEKPVVPLTHIANTDRWYDRLCYANDGILHEDVQVQVGIKSEYHSQLGRIAVYIGNKLTVPLESFTATVSSPDSAALSVSFQKIPASSVPARTQAQHVLQAECRGAFKSPPIMTVSFMAGSHQAISLRLPIVMSKFVEPVTLPPSDFFERWRIIGGPPREAQAVFPITLDAVGQIDTPRNLKVVGGHRFHIIEGIDSNPANIVAAGVLHMSQAGKVGCLLRFEPNKEAKVRLFRFILAMKRELIVSPALSVDCQEYIRGSFERAACAAAETPQSRRCLMISIPLSCFPFVIDPHLHSQSPNVITGLVADVHLSPSSSPAISSFSLFLGLNSIPHHTSEARRRTTHL